MTRPPAAPANLRNGLKWRDGRPRWEPSPANRACGFAGLNLTDAAGRWMDRGAAVSAADARNMWAATVREALREDDAGGTARAHLRAVLDALPPAPADPDAANRRRLVADLIERGRAVLENREPDVAGALARAPRTVGAMVQAYFADRTAMTAIKPATLKAYRASSHRILARFAARRVDDITPGQLRAWHGDLLKTVSVSTANLTMGTFGAMFVWATWQDPPWLTASPRARLRLPKAEGRLVFWTVDEEQAFIRWCDGHGYADVADAVTVCLWTGARQVDVCKATLADLEGQTWRFVPQKTERKGQVALPGVLASVAARVARRRAEVAAGGVDFLSAPPLLWHPLGRRHTSHTIGERFAGARAASVKAGAMPAAFAAKRLQDARDTCVTRLYAAGLDFARIGSWGGWSNPEQILRAHYLTLLDAGAIEDGEKLLAWARTNGLDWAAA